MFRLNLKIALRNLWKNKGYALISIVGLAVGLTVFMLAMRFGNYERKYDRWNEAYQQVFRVNYTSGSEDVALSPGNMATLAKEKVAAVKASTRVGEYWMGDLLLKIKDKRMYLNSVLMVDSNFLKVFDYPFLYGNAEKALNSPQSIILTKKTSDLIFGEGVNPVGETMTLGKTSEGIVEGVIDEARFPAHFHFNILKRFRQSMSDEYYSNNYYTYVKLQEQSDLKQTTADLNQVRRETLSALLTSVAEEDKEGFHEFIDENTLYLQAVSDIHLSSKKVEYEFSGNGTGTYMYLMLVVAALVLIIAAVNFMNLSITMATKRAKETGVRKVLGAGRLQVALQFIMETAMQCVLSLMIAIVLLELLSPAFNSLVGQDITLKDWSDYYLLIMQIVGVLFLLILIVGLYPSLLISRVLPAKVLKGNFSSSSEGYLIRNGLIVVQFFIAVLFISGVWVIRDQLAYMQQKDLGYKPEQVMAISMMDDTSDEHFRQIRNTLMTINGINQISRADHIPGEDTGGNGYTVDGRSYASNFMSVDVNYIKAMGMTLLEGREFESSNTADTSNSVMITEAAARAFQLKEPLGKILKRGGSNYKVIGVVKDFNHFSPEKSYQPLVFQYIKGNPLKYVLVNLSTRHPARTIADVEAAWRGLEPDFPIKYTLLDQSFAGMLYKQAQLGRIIGMLSGVTIFLALMGIFAIAALTTQRRSKEINIRKVLGASIVDILTLLNSSFVKLVLLANVIAWPVAYVLLNNWLSDFAFRIQVPLLPFLAAGVATTVLTILIVSLQSYKVASGNVAAVLKYE
ncbi:putative FtsX-related transmembrane transport protein [Pedobacter sp. BAL39]|uniref:ABC transporter permease n=1 Tax=Pedobacter sp. BAL39 TaxID=391596 RepID=UPI0001559493|nr:ABC transporter permease [Pedobacter sp. BAL39]EDM38538.1 putative FtsX-related transmembrane transport protein [Pedobacter sp. BAL39]